LLRKVRNLNWHGLRHADVLARALLAAPEESGAGDKKKKKGRGVNGKKK